MIIRDEFILNCPHSEAWSLLSDIPTPISIMPEVVSLKEIRPMHYHGAARLHIGPFSFLFRGNMVVTEVDHVNYRVNIEGGATDCIINGNFTAKAYTWTLPHTNNRTRVVIEVHVGLGGILGNFGAMILRPKARSIVEAYGQAVMKAIVRRRLAATA